MKLLIKKGSTDQTVYLFIQDSSSSVGAGLTGLVYNSASLVCYYVRPLGSATALTLATQTVTGAHSDGGFVEVSSANMPGVYRLDLSDAIAASGVNGVVVMLKGATNMAPIALEIQLVDFDPNDAVALGLSRLDAAVTTRASQSSLDTLDDFVDTEVAAIKAKTDNLPSDPADASDIAASFTTVNSKLDTIDGIVDDILIDTAEIGAAGAGLTNINLPNQTMDIAGNITGNLSGSVGSVTSGVTVTTNNDKAGYGLSSAAVQAVWDALTSALTAAGSIGKLLVDNINATISSRASQASVDTIDDFLDTEVAAIKAKTDNLPAAPAATGDIPSAASIADAVWDEARADHVTAGTFGQGAASVQGNVTGSVASVTGAVGSVTASVTVGTNNDKAGYALTSGERTSIAEALLKLDLSTVTGEAARSLLNAIRYIRNKVSISGTTMTVCKEDDSTTAWTAALTETPGASPITGVDPS